MITCEQDQYIDPCIFYLKELLPLAIIPDVDIILAELGDNYAYVEREAHDKYEITLDILSAKEFNLPRVLAHECVHVKQYVLGELADTPTHFMWMGKIHPFNCAYRDYPWEKEAYELENILYDKYKNYINNIND